MKKKSVFDHQQIESDWQSVWERIGINRTDMAGQRPFYNLMMFPYPSAEGLHVGNMYAFTGSDIYGRFKRLQGFTVFEPIGLDGFGIHSENYALKVGRHPMEHATITEKNFYNQLRRIGAMFDWDRTVETYNPNYYIWTQWLFTELFKMGLAYRTKAEVNWCPSCKTVLADEQVIDGSCERCGNSVIKKALEQWFFRITAYAEKLLANSFSLNWTEKVRVAQQNWIGKKTGINISYQVAGSKQEVVCFTTKPVNYAATFLVLAPEHPQAVKLATNDRLSSVKTYIDTIKKLKPEQRVEQGREKTGVFTGSYAINHVTGKQIPIWISDFVIMGVGTGAIQACPGHDLRDFEFAKKFKLPIVRVVVGPDGDTSEITHREQVIEHGPGTMINSDFLNGLDFETAMQKTKEYFETKKWGNQITTYHLRDWLISRQRYWGPPIPMIFCRACAKQEKSWFSTPDAQALNRKYAHFRGKNDAHEWAYGWYPVPQDQLPVVLPRIDDYKPDGSGSSPLSRHQEFYQTNCPGCGGAAVRETDVSDTFLDSSWYFLRYPSVGKSVSKTTATNTSKTSKHLRSTSKDLPWDPDITKRWLPVHMYTGGAEHSVLHLMYSRFISMALRDAGYIDFDEPFTNFFAHGLVIKDGAKMSKSKGNVVNPDEYINQYGADALRLYLMFMGPYSQGGDFRDSAMEGMKRWTNRIWKLAERTLAAKKTVKPVKSVSDQLARLVLKVADDLEKRRYNTAIASMMEFTNAVEEAGATLPKQELSTFLIILSPFAPHLTEELYQKLHGRTAANTSTSDSIHTQRWPEVAKASISELPVTIAVQVNGKHRDNLVLPAHEAKDQKTIESLARQSPNVAKHLTVEPKRVIFVPGKIVNFVV